MANPTSVGLDNSQNPAMVVTDTTGVGITIDQTKNYLVRHTGLDNASTPAAALGTVYVTLGQSGTAITANGVEGGNKFPLLAGESMVVGPNAQTLGFRAASGTPVVSVVPLVTRRMI